MERPTHCLLTERPLQNSDFNPVTDGFIDYTIPIVGRVRVSVPEALNLASIHQQFRFVLAGICRNHFENGQQPMPITSSFVENDLKNIAYPKEFKAKVRHFLDYLYNKGGNENKSFHFQSTSDYPICYAESQNEFTRIVDYAEKNYWISWSKKHVIAGGVSVYRSIEMTTLGIEEVEKALPKIPLAALVNQAITTGDSATDEKINHAKDLFFQEPQTLDRMRSACEALSFVLEPMRDDIKRYFHKDDVSAFFQIVNTFDIRHNKEQTKSIAYPEQLEWVFYTLLNTINTYCKPRDRLES